MTWRHTAIAALVLLAAVACSRREEGAMGEPKMGDERGFVESTASSGMLEVKLGEYAVAHANSEPVREFARKMVEDHGRANQTLEIAAEAQQLKVPDAMLKLHEDTYKELTKLSGAEFDLAYAHAMVEGHEQSAAALRAEIARAPGTQVGQWASATLPTVETHLEHARQLVAEVAQAAPPSR